MVTFQELDSLGGQGVGSVFGWLDRQLTKRDLTISAAKQGHLL